MKVKQLPGDFLVEELTDVVPGQGDFALYRLDKVGWSTPDALEAIRRRWRIELDRLSCGGLKDRHAVTSQHFTIWKGPRRGLRHQQITVRYLGQSAEPFDSKAIRANRFAITVRGLLPERIAAIEQAVALVRQEGVPNYFDDQRFGSVSAGGEFMARALVQRRFEDALRLALTAPYEHDRAEDMRAKAILRRHWGDWEACRQRLPRSAESRLVDYLAHHPDDFKGALGRLRPDLRGLYLSAYQSHLWNRLLARWLEEHCLPDQLRRIDLKLGPLPVHQGLDAERLELLRRLALPLPSARLHLDAADPLKPLVDAVLAEDGLELRQLQVKGIRSLFFSKGERPALCLPAGLQHEIAVDELSQGKRRVTLHFELPRGAYATLIVKRVMAVPADHRHKTGITVNVTKRG